MEILGFVRKQTDFIQWDLREFLEFCEHQDDGAVLTEKENLAPRARFKLARLPYAFCPPTTLLIPE
jgi:hypothetical protein